LHGSCTSFLEVEMQKGDIVKMHDADDPRSIPAYRTMRGEVIEVQGRGIRVRWFDPAGLDLGTDVYFRRQESVVPA
jgi:hypothetical protein